LSLNGDGVLYYIVVPPAQIWHLLVADKNDLTFINTIAGIQRQQCPVAHLRQPQPLTTTAPDAEQALAIEPLFF